MKICFVYIRKYKNIEDVGISLDSHYLYSYDANRKELLIRDNKKHIGGFYGRNIYSLTVIAGNNGSGKTNVLRFILNAVVEGMNDKSLCDGIVVFRNANGKLTTYSTIKSVSVTYNGKAICKSNIIEGCRTFFYSSHAMCFPRTNDILLEELSGMYNATNSVRMVRDYENYTNTNALRGQKSYNDYLIAHLNQRSFKLLLFLKDYYSGQARLDKLVIPPRIMVLPNESGYYHFLSIENVKKDVQLNVSRLKNWKNKTLLNFFITSLLNVASNENDYMTWRPLIDSWVKTVRDSNSEDVLALWEQWAKGKKPAKELERIMKVVSTINSTCDYNETSGQFYLTIEGNEETVRKFIDEIYQTREFLAARFIDVAPTYDSVTDAMMSSGEEKFLYLMAEIYFSHIIHVQKYDNIEAPTLYVLDEAELGFHPAWQRKFISYLLDFFNHYDQKDLQIILTTHSPILLSDIAKRDIVLLEMKNKQTHLVEEHAETFATNIFELYRDSFFLNEGLMGEYAERIIKDIVSDIEKRENLDSLPKKIQQIGDPQIRNYLTMEYASINQNGAISLLEDQIRQIKKKYECSD